MSNKVKTNGFLEIYNINNFKFDENKTNIIILS